MYGYVWYMYLHGWFDFFYGFNVGKYTIPIAWYGYQDTQGFCRGSVAPVALVF